jgi:hypothetical protein
MDPLSIAGGFATIIQLIGQFKGERGAESTKTYDEFRAWLADNRHEDIIKLLEQNSNTLIGIKLALSEDRQVLIEMLKDLDRKMAILAAATITLTPLAQALHPDVTISPEALNFLQSFEQSGSGRALEFSNLQIGREIMTLDGPPTSRKILAPSDWRFFEDDIATMCDLRLLSVDYDESGKRRFHLSRKGAGLGQAMATSNMLGERAPGAAAIGAVVP